MFRCINCKHTTNPESRFVSLVQRRMSVSDLLSVERKRSTGSERTKPREETKKEQFRHFKRDRFPSHQETNATATGEPTINDSVS